MTSIKLHYPLQIQGTGVQYLPAALIAALEIKGRNLDLGGVLTLWKMTSPIQRNILLPGAKALIE